MELYVEFKKIDAEYISIEAQIPIESSFEAFRIAHLGPVVHLLGGRRRVEAELGF